MSALLLTLALPAICLAGGPASALPPPTTGPATSKDARATEPPMTETPRKNTIRLNAPLNDAAVKNREGVAAELEVAVLGGGCFWGMQELLRKLDGVVRTDVGYSGGPVDSASYDRVHLGMTGHAESVRVVFDPNRLTYERLITRFFRIHDPTTPNRQGNDFGTQYRSVIFVQTAEQRVIANAVKERLEGSGRLERSVATQVVSAMPYVPAEDEHQDYLQKHPGGYTCHYERKFEF